MYTFRYRLMGNLKRYCRSGAVSLLVVFLWSAYTVCGQMREALVAVPGAHIHYRDSGGTGVPVIFLHSASGNRDAWEQQIGAFTASGYRVITYDRRGWGHSVDEPGNAQPWTAAGDLLAVVNRLGIDRFHLVSTALGGYVGFDFAISHPDRLRSLVVANSLGGLQDPQLVELGRRLRSKEFDALRVEIRELGPEYRAANAEGVKRWLEHEKDSRHKGSPAPSTPLTNRLTLALLETISTPVLLLTGDADLYAPPSLQNIFSAHIKRVETAVIPGVGHNAYWEEPVAPCWPFWARNSLPPLLKCGHRPQLF